jgi:hypothetical protein
VSGRTGSTGFIGGSIRFDQQVCGSGRFDSAWGVSPRHELRHCSPPSLVSGTACPCTLPDQSLPDEKSPPEPLILPLFPHPRCGESSAQGPLLKPGTRPVPKQVPNLQP